MFPNSMGPTTPLRLSITRKRPRCAMLGLWVMEERIPAQPAVSFPSLPTSTVLVDHAVVDQEKGPDWAAEAAADIQEVAGRAGVAHAQPMDQAHVRIQLRRRQDTTIDARIFGSLWHIWSLQSAFIHQEVQEEAQQQPAAGQVPQVSG